MDRKPPNRNHLHRWLTAIVALPVLVGVLGLAPPSAVLLLVVAVVVAGSVELARMLLGSEPAWIRHYAAASAVVIPLAAYLIGPAGLAAGTVALLLLDLGLGLHLFARGELRLSQLTGLVFARCYVALPISHILPLLEIDAGRRWLFFALGIVFAGDTGAYYSGYRWGRRKLAPKISPGKTLAGALGGLLAAVAVGIFLSLVLLEGRLSPALAMLVAAGLGIAGQVGDLAESMLKRLSGVKDASTLLPGHGGILDRLDSLIFALPLIFYLATLLEACGS